MWVNPSIVFMQITKSIFGAVEGDLRVSVLNPVLEPFYYFIILVFKLSPITLAIFIYTLFNFKKIKSIYTYLILASIFVFLIFLTLSSQKIDRYSLVFFPSIILLISILISKIQIQKTLFIIFLSLLTTTYSFIVYSPNLSAFYSPLFGGTNQALQIGVYENGGDFVSKSAFYLNQHDRNYEVYVPNNFEAFSLFFGGKSVREITPKTKYIIYNLDIDRRTYDEKYCKEIIKTFGSLEKEVVAICKINNDK
jgi:hypothetical protein